MPFYLSNRKITITSVGDQPQHTKYLLPGQRHGNLENIIKEYDDNNENNKMEQDIG